jgi:hypothetical protein
MAAIKKKVVVAKDNKEVLAIYKEACNLQTKVSAIHDEYDAFLKDLSEKVGYEGQLTAKQTKTLESKYNQIATLKNKLQEVCSSLYERTGELPEGNFITNEVEMINLSHEYYAYIVGNIVSSQAVLVYGRDQTGNIIPMIAVPMQSDDDKEAVLTPMAILDPDICTEYHVVKGPSLKVEVTNKGCGCQGEEEDDEEKSCCGGCSGGGGGCCSDKKSEPKEAKKSEEQMAQDILDLFGSMKKSNKLLN